MGWEIDPLINFQDLNSLGLSYPENFLIEVVSALENSFS